MKKIIFLLVAFITSFYSYSQTIHDKAGKLKMLEGKTMHFTMVAAANGSGVDSISIPVFSGGAVFEIGGNKIICDSAIVDIETITAYNVIITSPSGQNITGNQFAYDNKTQNGILQGQITSYKKDKKILGQFAALNFSGDNYKIVKIK